MLVSRDLARRMAASNKVAKTRCVTTCIKQNRDIDRGTTRDNIQDNENLYKFRDAIDSSNSSSTFASENCNKRALIKKNHNGR